MYRAIRAWKVANPDVLPILDDGMWRPSGPPGDRGVLREVGSKGRLNQRGMASARLPSTETLSRGAGKFILTLVWAISMTSCFVNRSSPVCVSACSWVGTTARSGYGRKPDECVHLKS